MGRGHDPDVHVHGRSPPTRSNVPSWRTAAASPAAAGVSSPHSSRKSVPPSARSNHPCRVPTAPVKLPRSWPNSSESTRSGGMAPQLTRRNGPGRPPRPLVNRAGHDLLARPRLAQDQHRRIRARDQLDLLHHRLQPGLRADDRVADVVPVQPRQQRPLVRLERLAERDQLAQPRSFSRATANGSSRACTSSTCRGANGRAALPTTINSPSGVFRSLAMRPDEQRQHLRQPVQTRGGHLGRTARRGRLSRRDCGGTFDVLGRRRRACTT